MDDEIDMKEIRGPIKMVVSNRIYRNAAGVGFLWKPSGTDEIFAADFSGLKFRRVDYFTLQGNPGLELEIPVDIDTLESTIDQLASLSGKSRLLVMGDSERKAMKSHVDDLRNIAGDLVEMQKVIINRVARKEPGV